MTEEDEAAFDEFLAARSTALLRTAILVCGASAHDAEDLAQGALEKVYRHWPRIRHAGGVRAAGGGQRRDLPVPAPQGDQRDHLRAPP
ncbi:SigE family RNA polymerase sigma factor [Sphaerisporangium corydalis]|uniref:RNA polymerase sigma-70 region 2 domain-containing protein n=1 Tax=Sphaerisporangium corydalis TaxID=1441875 RepID=A0ABV9EN69_9ACTN|nr:hypothetical protein [Sphaerisporangium corydalis]